ncbi:LysR family transcriptional regulator [Bradyrhizobium sp. CW7]|uniref:LysR family transcriptional regulator n=1 Tax=Bradyrhizobium sp. CW7 TaxID=2782688 RepID=UPI001FFADC61|nr:LysR family transcriptional regulator [Bradyrhizobium sp. CW7]MCK1356250.1 LysR family transcriptional regulator [Bradyrhizobium sp. CW7]
MDLRQILYFVRVYEERSFTKAAGRVNVVQPALSRQIAALEVELGSILFIRGSKGITPTSTATILYQRVNPLLRDFASIREEIRSLANVNVVGSIACGFPPTYNRFVTGKALMEFSTLYPDVQITVVEAFSGKLTELVKNGELDFALGARPAESSGLVTEFEFAQEVALVCGEPVAGPSFQRCILSELTGIKLLLASPEHVIGKQVKEHIDSGMLRPSKVMYLGSSPAMMDLIKSAGWCGISPVAGLLEESDRSDLYIYPIDRSVLEYRLSLVRAGDRPLSQAASAFLQIAKRYSDRIQPVWQAVLLNQTAHFEKASEL